MARSRKTACKSSGGRIPPRVLIEELQEQQPQEQPLAQGDAPPTPVQAPKPEEEELEEDLEELMIIDEDDDDDDEEVLSGGQPPSPPQDVAAGGDAPPPPIGWTLIIHNKHEHDGDFHHRLAVLLSIYYPDLRPAVNYVSREYTHPHEDTYWKTSVWILIKDVEKDSFVLDRSYRHMGHRATMEASLDDAAFEAYLGLHSQRFNAMHNDVHRYLPHAHPKLGWGMMDPRNLEVIPREMAHFIYELMEKNDRLQDMVVAQGKSLSRC
jgi:hypothetical protein